MQASTNVTQAVARVLYYAGIPGNNFDYSSVGALYGTPDMASLIGYHFPANSGKTCWDALSLLANSVHASLSVSATGDIRFVQISSNLTISAAYTGTVTNTANPIGTLTDDDYVAGSLTQTGIIPRLNSVLVGAVYMSKDNAYRQNYRRFPIAPREIEWQDGGEIPTMLIGQGGMDTFDNGNPIHPEDKSQIRETSYWRARMAQTRKKYTVTVPLSAYQYRVGDMLTLNFSELGAPRNANIVRILRNNDYLLSKIEVLLEND